jgi:hypothetical protein
MEMHNALAETGCQDLRIWEGGEGKTEEKGMTMGTNP